MRGRITLFATVFFALSLFLAGPVLAVCGSYFSGQCVDAATNTEVSNPVRCTQNPQICCASQTECDQEFNQSDDPFGGTGDATEVEEEPTPQPEQQPQQSTDFNDSDFQQEQTRGCGTYFPTLNECNNAEASGPEANISPFVVCGNGVSCCPQASMCPVAPVQPEPEPDEISNESCGALQRDFTCRDLRGLIIPNSQQCSQAGDEYIANECCRELGQCSLRPVVETQEEEESDPLEAYQFCLQIPEGQQRQACIACVGNAADVNERIFTAVGCLRTSREGLAGDLIRLGLGIGGGLSLLSILAAAFLVATSQGDGEKLKSARSLATGSVSGLLFMIFSVIILNFVGVEILRIPGLSSSGSGSTSQQQSSAEEPLTTTELLGIRPQLTPTFDGFRIAPEDPLQFCARSTRQSAFGSQYGLAFSWECLSGGEIGCEAPPPQTSALSPVRDSTGGQYEQCVTVNNLDIWAEGIIREYLVEELGAQSVAQLQISVSDTHNEYNPGYQTYLVRIEPAYDSAQAAWLDAYRAVANLDPIVYSIRLNWELNPDNSFAGSWQIQIDFDRSNFPQG